VGNNLMSILAGVLITPLKEISTPGGNVMHAMKSIDTGFSGFGEAYFSKIEPGAIKPWKRHRLMTLNLIVPLGSIRFVIYDDRPYSPTIGKFQEVILSPVRYSRLTIPPMLWMAFQGSVESGGMLLNIADIMHDPNECDRKPIEQIGYIWNQYPA
jgi:dTDP-4-dehydrorhamnose 3,5-epimerase